MARVAPLLLVTYICCISRSRFLPLFRPREEPLPYQPDGMRCVLVALAPLSLIYTKTLQVALLVGLRLLKGLPWISSMPFQACSANVPREFHDGSRARARFLLMSLTHRPETYRTG